jgi:hypothetical protein
MTSRWCNTKSTAPQKTMQLFKTHEVVAKPQSTLAPNLPLPSAGLLQIIDM